MNNDLISRSDIKTHISELMLVYNGTELDNVILNAIDNAPTVEPDENLFELYYQDGYEKGYERAKADYLKGYEKAKKEFERPQGEWVDEGQYAECQSAHAYICKNCGYQIIELPSMIFENRFCKYCGAQMKGGAKE